MLEDDLFTANDAVNAAYQPMAARMRPKKLAHYVGQQHILADNSALKTAIVNGQLHSMILWGPPGVGKTTLAKIIAVDCDAQFLELSAVLAGVKDIRAAVEKAQVYRHQHQKSTILFVDEVHRFNKAQQDAFLPHIESGEIIFIGATTENPSFELNSALLSRARVYVLKSLQESDLLALIQRVLDDDPLLRDVSVVIDESHRQKLATAADGDARRCLNLLELSLDLAPLENGEKTVDEAIIKQVLIQSYRRFDKGGEQFYDQISAFHKSVRGSDPDAALYWLCRMLDGGCDGLYLARRIVRIASEDIGNADPRALQIAMDAWQVQERLGSPEGELALAQAVIYLAAAPKSNAVYNAYNQCRELIATSASDEVPLHIRNAPTKLMKELDYGEGYRYAHNEDEAFAAGECYLPENLREHRFYTPVDRGLEKKIGEKMRYLQQLNTASTNKRYPA